MKSKLAPVARYSAPKYPTKEAVNANPQLFAHVPRRWASNPYVLTALSLVMAAGLTACGKGQSFESIFPSGAPAVSGSASPDPASSDPVGSARSEADALDIPIFAHGTGRGGYGCESVAPPVFLSEEEAMQVIAEECAAQGIDISGTKTISGTFPATSLVPGSDTGDTYTGSLTLDGYSEDLDLGIEFVSSEDILDWEAPSGMHATVDDFRLKDTAQRLSDATDRVAVFYDPTASSYEDFTGSNEESYVENGRLQSLEELRNQVRDFLQWLKAQGVI